MITKRDIKGRIAKGSNQKHGYSKHAIYDCWIAMKARCQNEQHPTYKYYGGRGIKICEQWLEFTNFLADMGLPPQKGTLDRCNNDGNYEPSNCRWITLQEQQKNRSNNNSFVGVTWEPIRGKWRADIAAKGTKYFLGRFKELSDALSARQKAEQALWV